MKKSLRIAAILLIMLMAFTVSAFAMDGPPPDGGGAAPDAGGAAPDAGGAAPDAGAPADAAAAPAEEAGPATGGIAIAGLLFAICGVGAAVTVPAAIKK